MAGKKTRPFEGKLFIKKGDTIVVLVGKDKGQKGEVLRAYPKTGKVLVKGINIATKHQKGTPTATNPKPEGGRVEMEVPILASKIALINKDGQPTRIRVETKEGKKVRVATKGARLCSPL